ncbi:superoxide dismutase [Streptomyces sp. SID5785]|uniref:SMP-30/gluconolactonase/LRE family protein n=1 Tax=Streptomyces sp. SID5785 TaxID=2690309 RepID=UPI00136122C5|nr:SMP-30/gluconolactonase/LRE family protein [Streptomyces sp. SID5785]MZD04646.1 superoxide dismutase [Streptomyces sp. SID5785]
MLLTAARRRITACALALACALVDVALAPVTDAHAGAEALTVARAIALPGNQAYPESMATDPATGDLYITSFGTGAVYRARAGQTEAETFLPAGTDGRTQAMGTTVDRHGRLWVDDASGVTVYDTADGTRLARFVSPTPGDSLLDDIALTPDGTAYVTDSLLQLVYRLPAATIEDTIAAAGTATLDVGFDLNSVVAEHPVGAITLNGIESDADGTYLITADMTSGELFRLEPATGGIRKITVSGGALLSADGLLWEKDQLWAAQFASDGVTRVALSADRTTATVTAQVSDGALQHPTALLRLGGSLHVLRSQFGSATLDLPFSVAKVSGV